MTHFPHTYLAKATAEATGSVAVDSAGLPTLETGPPEQFGGSGDVWSPETMLVAAVANCYILSFRAIARASKLDWLDLDCEVEGVLDRIERVTQFTHFDVKARLVLPAGSDLERARRVLERSEQACLITSSLKGTSALDASIEVADPAPTAS